LFLTLGMAAFAVPALAATLASTLDVYVFPSDGQAESQQSQDEATCYDWAVDNSGGDPFDLSKQQQQADQQAAAQTQAAQQSTAGAGVGGAVRGAAVGALVGEIASDDAGKGAAWGAGLGAVHSRRSARRHASEAQAQAQGQADQSRQYTQQEIDNFKKAFSVCLEAKNYMVKY